MRTKTAVEVDLGERGKGWHYASIGKRGGGPIGYCADHAPHATETEARECFSSYLLTQLRAETYGDWTSCQYPHNECGRPTKSGWGVPATLSSVALCEVHDSRELAIACLGLNKPWGDSFGSI